MNKIIRQIWGRAAGRNWRDWRWQVENRIKDVSRIAGLFALSPKQKAALKTVAAHYPFCVTPYYLSLCNPKDRRDPLVRQFMPDRREMPDKKTLLDPLGEEKYSPVPGLIHRYRNRVVIITTADCAVRCRHCTRKNTLRPFADFVAGVGLFCEVPTLREIGAKRDAPGLKERLPQIIKYIRGRPQIREVIVSGGDPLLLATAALDEILGELASIKNVEVLRIGTRVPVVLPMRVNAKLCDCLKAHRPLWVNTQFNHPREITGESERACRLMQEAGLPVSNQTVLLRGVNDSVAVLEKLFNNLQRIMVRPYYAFQCDRVRGVKHFGVPSGKAVKLSGRLRARLGGLSMPLFVADLPGRKGKVPLEAEDF